MQGVVVSAAAAATEEEEEEEESLYTSVTCLNCRGRLGDYIVITQTTFYEYIYCHRFLAKNYVHIQKHNTKIYIYMS